MLKTIFPLALSICLINALAAQMEIEPLFPETDPAGHDPYSSPVSLEDGQNVRNGAILGPTDELLPPYIATQALYGTDYFEWCLRWNKLQEYLAKKRARPPRTLGGWLTRRQGYSEGSSSGYGFAARSASFRNSFNSLTDTRQQEWRLGGYGGGPVTIYNPFVTR